MTAQQTTPSLSRRQPRTPARRVSPRTLALSIAATAVIATGAYTTARRLGPNGASDTHRAAIPSTEAMRDMRDTVIGLYGRQSATGSPIAPRDDVLREYRDTTIALYGPPR